MLFFLDNQQSVGPDSRASGKGKRGLNENLAREIMELHTLGADGGYTQRDVTGCAAGRTWRPRLYGTAGSGVARWTHKSRPSGSRLVEPPGRQQSDYPAPSSLDARGRVVQAIALFRDRLIGLQGKRDLTSADKHQRGSAELRQTGT